MFNRFAKFQRTKASNPWALLTGWVWFCALTVGGGLGLMFTLSGFGSPDPAPDTAREVQLDPAVSLDPGLLPTPGLTLDVTAPAEVPPATSLPLPPVRSRAEMLSEKPGATRALTGSDFWEGPLVIGLSVDGRPLEVYRFGSGPDRRMIVAGIHGGYEWNTVALADELTAYLQGHPDQIPSGVTLYILRVMNPDGLARGQWYEGRMNANGVDLNRNFPSNWQVEWPNSGCWSHLPVSSGESAASEPETQAVMDFVRNHPLTALISYHSAFLGIFPGGIPLHLPSVDLAQVVADATTYRYPPVETGCMYTGTLADWAADQGAAAVDLELHTHENTDFVENLAVLKIFLNWQPPVMSGR